MESVEHFAIVVAILFVIEVIVFMAKYLSNPANLWAFAKWSLITIGVFGCIFIRSLFPPIAISPWFWIAYVLFFVLITTTGKKC